MYLNKEDLKNASIENILEELDAVYEQLLCVERFFPTSKSYALRAYSNRLLDEIKARIEKMR